MADTPNSRTKRWLEAFGYYVGKVELFKRFPDKQRPGKWLEYYKDLWDWVDQTAFHPDIPAELKIQNTSSDNLSKRIRKADALPAFHAYIKQPNRIALFVGWSVAGPAGKRKRWTPRVVQGVRGAAEGDAGFIPLEIGPEGPLFVPLGPPGTP